MKQSRSFLSYLYILLICVVLIGCEKHQPTSEHTAFTAQEIIPLMPTDDSQYQDLADNPDALLDGAELSMLPTSSNQNELINDSTQTEAYISAKNDQKQSQPKAESNNITAPNEPKGKKGSLQENTSADKELDVEVENKTGKTIYVTCFSYIKRRPFSRWRWNKSQVYKIKNNESTTIDLPTINDKEDRNNTFGYLGVFENKKNAENSIFELLDDAKKIDLDIVAQLKGKKVIIEIEKYGIDGEFYDYDFVKRTKLTQKYPELDFYVENKIGKPVYITCFVYQKKAKGTWLAIKTKEAWTTDDETRDDMSIWRFDKTPVIKLMPNETKIIDVDTIIEPRDREYVRGYLVIFDENEKEMAEKSVYELLPIESRRKLDLGRLVDMKKKKIEIYTERYGIMGNLIDYSIKPTQKPDFKKVIENHLNIK
jgi:hypothetical protein